MVAEHTHTAVVTDPLPSELDAGEMFSLLIASLRRADAMVLDTSGLVVWSCPRCGGIGPVRTGTPLHETAPDAWANELASVVGRACAEGRSLHLMGIARGVRTVTRVTPLTGGGSRNRALVVAEQADHEEVARLQRTAPAETLVWSNVHDLGPLGVLTARELEVLALLGQGKRTKEIAETLHRSVSTVDGHRERIGQKLGLNDRAELVSLARRAALRVEDAAGVRVSLNGGRGRGVRPRGG